MHAMYFGIILEQNKQLFDNWLAYTLIGSERFISKALTLTSHTANY